VAGGRGGVNRNHQYSTGTCGYLAHSQQLAPAQPLQQKSHFFALGSLSDRQQKSGFFVLWQDANFLICFSFYGSVIM